MLWRRVGEDFEGAAEGDGCSGVLFAGQAGVSPPIRLNLSSRSLTVTASKRDGQYVTELRRARPFTCWAGVLRGERHGASGQGKDDRYFTRDARLHDQYGEAIITTGEKPARKVSVRLRNVDWPYGTNRPSLTLYVHEAGNDRAISYAWAQYDADRIGIDLRWMQVSCTWNGAE